MDGSRFESVLKTIYEIEGSPSLTILYTETQWEALTPVSPCLIEVNLQSPLLQFLIDHPFERYGYILIAKDRQLLETQLRSLLTVSTPSGENVLLKFADPEVAARLLLAQRKEFWQAIAQVWLPSVRQQAWQHQVSKLSNDNKQQPGGVTLTEHEYRLLGDVSHLNFVQQLKRYMEKWFAARLPQQQEIDWIYFWSEHAYQLGFTSQQAQTLFFAVLGYLGEGFSSAPEYQLVHQYLSTPSILTPDQRAEKAAELAHGYWLKQNQKEVS
nr:DUF4123 domain-containing protein [Motilimonas sp. E26]